MTECHSANLRGVRSSLLLSVKAEDAETLMGEMQRFFPGVEAVDPIEFMVRADMHIKATENIVLPADMTPTQAPRAASPAAQPAGTPAPSCPHGQRIYKEGVGKKGRWAAWMCAAGQNDPSRCQPEWIDLKKGN